MSGDNVEASNDIDFLLYLYERAYHERMHFDALMWQVPFTAIAFNAAMYMFLLGSLAEKNIIYLPALVLLVVINLFVLFLHIKHKLYGDFFSMVLARLEEYFCRDLDSVEERIREICRLTKLMETKRLVKFLDSLIKQREYIIPYPKYAEPLVKIAWRTRLTALSTYLLILLFLLSTAIFAYYILVLILT